jgi:DNA-binding CsgD family transcriptional regulator
MVVDGHASKQIARRLNISAKTVSNHRAHLLRKTGATNTADRVSRAVRLLDPRAAA